MQPEADSDDEGDEADTQIDELTFGRLCMRRRIFLKDAREEIDIGEAMASARNVMAWHTVGSCRAAPRLHTEITKVDGGRHVVAQVRAHRRLCRADRRLGVPRGHPLTGCHQACLVVTQGSSEEVSGLGTCRT